MKSILMLLQRILVLLPLFFIALQVQADEHDKEGVEKISVIGSHIKRTDVEGPSPVLVIDREQIELSGYHALADILRDLPSASFGGRRESAGSWPAATTTTSLRGLEMDSILLLLNGKRTIGDLTTLPVSVVERIEILKDGASAIYGSDAVGGVINIITKRGDIGGQVNVSGSLVPREEGNSLSALASYVDFYDWDTKGHPDPDEKWSGKGDKLTIDASYGGTKGSTDYLVGGQVRISSPIYYRDRSFGKLEKKDYSQQGGSPGSWKVVGEKNKWQPFLECPSGNIVEDNKGNKYCGFNYSPYMQLTPQVLQGSTFFHVGTDLTSNTTLSADILYSYIRSRSIMAAGVDRFEEKTNFKEGTKVSYAVPGSLAGTLGFPTTEDINIAYRTVEEKGAGIRTGVENVHFMALQGNLVQSVGSTMEADFGLNFSGWQNTSTGVTGYLNIEKMKDMMEAGTFNPLSPSGSKADLTTVHYKPVNTSYFLLSSFEPKLTGELAEIGGQPLSFAVGGLGAWEMYDKEDDDITASGKQWGGGVPSSGGGYRLYGAMYGELSALFGGMAQVDLALRSDYYSDFGFPDQKVPFTDPDDSIGLPITPSLKFSFQPVKQIKFRASWGQGFRAPDLTQLHRDTTISHPDIVDTAICGNECTAQDAQQVEVHFLGNLDLEPEYAENFNIGLVLEPINKISFNVDVYRNHLTNMVTRIGSVRAQGAFAQSLVDYGVEKGSEAVQALGSSIEREGDTIKQVNAKPTNAEEYKVWGFEVGLNALVFTAGPWNMNVGIEHAHSLYIEKYNKIIKKKSCLVPFYGFLDDWIGGDDSCNKKRKDTVLETWNGYPRWKNQITFMLMNKDKGYDIQLVVTNIPGQLDLPADPSGFIDKETGTVNKELKKLLEAEIDYYWQVDLFGRFALSKNSSIIAGIKNILAIEPPLQSNWGSSGYVYANLYPVEGRTINVRYTHNF